MSVDDYFVYGIFYAIGSIFMAYVFFKFCRQSGLSKYLRQRPNRQCYRSLQTLAAIAIFTELLSWTLYLPWDPYETSTLSDIGWVLYWLFSTLLQGCVILRLNKTFENNCIVQIDKKTNIKLGIMLILFQIGTSNYANIFIKLVYY